MYRTISNQMAALPLSTEEVSEITRTAGDIPSDSRSITTDNVCLTLGNSTLQSHDNTEDEWTDEEIEEYVSLDVHDPELLSNPHLFDGMVVHNLDTTTPAITIAGSLYELKSSVPIGTSVFYCDEQDALRVGGERYRTHYSEEGVVLLGHVLRQFTVGKKLG